MTEINSTKINKNIFLKKIQKNIDEYEKNKNSQRDINKIIQADNVRASLKNQSPKFLKILASIFYRFGLSKVVFFAKERLANTSLFAREVYLVDDFCKYHDIEFIKNVYLGVLKRDVDSISLQHYLNLLHSGKRTKTEILSIIRFSKEGRIHNVAILGIKKRYIMAVLYRLPIIGYISKILITILLLPKNIAKLNSFEAAYHIQNIQNNEKIRYLQNEAQQNYEELLEKYNNLNSTIQALHKYTDEKVNLSDFHKDISSMESGIKSYVQEKHNLLVEFTKQNIENKMRDINSAKMYIRDIQKSIKDLVPDENNPLSKVLNSEKEHLLDDFYVAFEDEFRGSREDIQQRQAYYLQYIQDVIKDSNDLVIDVGCGRGEWIELLANNNIKAKGIDLNRLMVSESVSYGLDALNMDAIIYLKSLEEGSVCVVTGFHIVEHLPFEVLIELFDESYRVLKKGGMIVFETPNPENILVGSCSFYTDPTHINPIPPVTLEFIAKNRGFLDVNIHRLAKRKEAQFLSGENTQDVNDLIFASTKEQDYSVIGYKI